MNCLGCGEEINHYLQYRIIKNENGWFNAYYYPLQGCETCIPDHDGVWEEEE